MSNLDEDKLKEARDFYVDRIKGWMVSDLKKSLDAGTNFLTALGCLVYTEIIGTFLPSLENENGTIKSRRFYRCFYRLGSAEYLKQVDTIIVKETRKNLYEHLRHNMAHKYYPAISKRHGNIVLFLPLVIARKGIRYDRRTGKRTDAPPVFVDNDDRVVIASRNFVKELEQAVEDFYVATFEKNDTEFQRAAINGADVVLRGQP